MDRRLVIDGNAVYEIDEKCMLKKQLEEGSGQEKEGREEKKTPGRAAESYKRKRTE